MQQKANEQKRQIEDVQIQRVQRIGGLREVAHQVRGAQRDDDPGENRRMFEPRARRDGLIADC